jgi:hypothetical protein
MSSYDDDENDGLGCAWVLEGFFVVVIIIVAVVTFLVGGC